MKLKRKKITKEIEEVSKSEPDKISLQNQGNFRFVHSTGSTLLDLAISGGRVRGGGVPSGIVMEIYGPSGWGKTALLVELGASVQLKGGEVLFIDPEARLDHQYARLFDLNIPKDNYHMPDTVSELFDIIEGWETPKDKGHMIAADSLAAFSTLMEMEEDDKYGMRRAKEFSQGFRKTCRLIEKRNWLVACSNQIRTGPTGNFTPTGNAIAFHSSVRIQINPCPPPGKKYVEKTITIEGKQHKKIEGVHCICKIKKNSVDDPYREADMYIKFGYGIDDIRANLQYVKDIKGSKTYGEDFFEKPFSRMEKAISKVEEEEYEEQLRDRVIDLWFNLQEKLKTDRKKKIRR